MEAYHTDQFGSVDRIMLREDVNPQPGRRGGLMRVRRPLNYRDLMVLKGGGRGLTKIGVIPLSMMRARSK